MLVAHLDGEQKLTDELRAEISARNNKLINYKRIGGVILYGEDFPLNASMKLVRPESVWGAFAISQLTLLVLLIPRFWQRGVAVSYWQQRMMLPVVPMRPIEPRPIEPQPVPIAVVSDGAPVLHDSPLGTPGS